MRKMAITKITILVVFMVGIAFCASSCKKKSPVQDEQAVTEVILQKSCPVMHGPINKELYTVYKGKKVYFCCPGCKEQFDADPEKFIKDLPQFQE